MPLLLIPVGLVALAGSGYAAYTYFTEDTTSESSQEFNNDFNLKERD